MRLIIFEDELLIAEDLKRQLSRFGYEVAAMFSKAEAGIKYLESLSDQGSIPEVVLMDISLAGNMSGTDAAIIISEKFPCAIVFLTGMSQFEFFEEAFKTKPFAFLIKPFEVNQAIVSIKLAVYQKNIELQLKKCKITLEDKIRERDHDMTLTKRTAHEAVNARNKLLMNLEKTHDATFAIEGLSVMMKETIKDKAELIRYAEYLEDNSHQLFALLNNMLDPGENETIQN